MGPFAMWLNLIPYFFFLAVAIAVPAFLVHVVLRFLRAYEVRNENRLQIATMQQQLSRLEESVANVQDELHRLTEENAFTTRLLSDRTRK